MPRNQRFARTGREIRWRGGIRVCHARHEHARHEATRQSSTRKRRRHEMSTTVPGAPCPFPSSLGVHPCSSESDPRGVCLFSFDSLPDDPPRASVGRAGTVPRTVRNPAPTGSSPRSPRSSPTSASSRRARKPTSTSSAAGCPTAPPRRPSTRSSPPSATAPASTGCSTGTPATTRAAGSVAAARCGRWPGAPSSARSCSRVSGRWPSSRRSERCGDGVPVPYPVQLTTARC